ncbi:MAG: hypothetical protein KatS3mg124_2135 [Porticoccaceae bacterium]|nr:MAG: hypothetical protein KatS3mg124_2135 [Porticoccaceae bacterium]
MRRLAICLLGLCLAAGWATAQELALNQNAPSRYVVKEGDTLWDIAALYLRDPWRWPELWRANPQVENPHLIYPGDVLTLVWENGRPRLALTRVGAGAANGPALRGGDGRTVYLKPQVQVFERERAIPSLPLKAINSFLVRTRVVAPGELEAAPYVLAGSQRRILSGAGDDFYVRGPLAAGVELFGIYRAAEPYRDAASGELLGIKALDVGSAQLVRREGEVAVFRATRSAREILPGDRLLPHEERRLRPVFHPRPPDREVHGTIIDVEGGVNQVGTLSVVAIDRGERDGLQQGDVLAIHKRGEVVRDRVQGDEVLLPAERAGLLMVFRTFEGMSFGLVTTASLPLAVGDLVGNP